MTDETRRELLKTGGLGALLALLVPGFRTANGAETGRWQAEVPNLTGLPQAAQKTPRRKPSQQDQLVEAGENFMRQADAAPAIMNKLFHSPFLLTDKGFNELDYATQRQVIKWMCERTDVNDPYSPRYRLHECSLDGAAHCLYSSALADEAEARHYGFGAGAEITSSVPELEGDFKEQARELLMEILARYQMVWGRPLGSILEHADLDYAHCGDPDEDIIFLLGMSAWGHGISVEDRYAEFWEQAEVEIGASFALHSLHLDDMHWRDLAYTQLPAFFDAAGHYYDFEMEEHLGAIVDLDEDDPSDDWHQDNPYDTPVPRA